MSKQQDVKSCPPSRWFLLKQKLNNLTPESFVDKIHETPDAVILDVRKSDELCNGSLPDSVNINYFDYDFWEVIKKMDPNRPYFVYCQSGRRSIRACTLMKNGGFKRIYNLDGGLNNMPKKYLIPSS